MDQYGNYTANLNSTNVTAGGLSIVLSGSGAPDNSTGSDGNLYVDLDTGDIYEKISGAWTLFSGGGSGTQEVYGGADDPEGAVSADGPAIYLRSADVNGDRRIYVKPTGSSGNTGWTLSLTYQV